jgi:1-deoxy-D-xylulose-5-phosphate synthase
MVIMTPSDENECRQMLYTGYHYNDGPSAVRYPRGTGTGATLSRWHRCRSAKAW